MKEGAPPELPPLLERYTFMAVTTNDLARARTFWVHHMRCPVVEEREGEYVIVDAGGLKVCVDVDPERDGEAGNDPVLAFKVASVGDVIAALRGHGVSVVKVDVSAENGKWVEIRDPDGRTLLLTEPD
jgi:predicted enzyme related to lactoylglutathione lyase